jgi:integrase
MVAPELGALALADVTVARIGAARDKLASGVTRRGTPRTPATVTRYLAALGHLLSVAATDWEWLQDNSMGRVRKPTEPRGRVRFLSEGPGGELERLSEACKASPNRYLFPAFILALSTGTRRAETLGLTWDDVDLKGGAIILRQTKNGSRRRVPAG